MIWSVSDFAFVGLTDEGEWPVLPTVYSQCDYQVGYGCTWTYAQSWIWTSVLSIDSPAQFTYVAQMMYKCLVNPDSNLLMLLCLHFRQLLQWFLYGSRVEPAHWRCWSEAVLHCECWTDWMGYPRVIHPRWGFSEGSLDWYPAVSSMVPQQLPAWCFALPGKLVSSSTKGDWFTAINTFSMTHIH